MTRNTSALGRWSPISWLLLLSSITLSAFVYFLMRWALPQEDDIGADRLFGCLLLLGMAVTLVVPKRARWFVLPVWLIACACFLAAMGQMLSLMIGLCVLGPAFAVFLFILFAQRKGPSPLTRPFVSACVPPFVVFALFLSTNEYKKQSWPWTPLQSPLQQFRRQANAAAARLGLRHDRALRVDELERLAKEAPLKLELSLPVLPLPVTARIYDLSETTVMLYWGDAQFGPLDVNSMTIGWASD